MHTPSTPSLCRRSRLRARIGVGAATLGLLLAVLLTGCGGSSTASDGSSDAPKVIDVTISGDTVTPNGTTVDVAVGQPIEIDLTSDSAGELHVHTAGDGQEFEYPAGTSTIRFSVDAPGVVPVESHTIDKTIVQLQAR